MIILKRAKSFLKRIQWLSAFTPTPLHAIYFLIKLKLKPNMLGHAKYNDLDISFHREDMSAIFEVLYDKEYKFLTPILQQKDAPVILDVGGNIGTFALWTLAENKNAQILSVEPSQKTYQTLAQNVKYANDNGLNWHSVKRAAWRNDEELSFASEGDSMGHKVLESGTYKVQGISLMEMVQQHLQDTKSDHIDILKIDIEGAEESFLCDDLETNRDVLQQVDHLVIELHENYCNAQRVHDFLITIYPNISNQEDRLSNKPLLLCSR